MTLDPDPAVTPPAEETPARASGCLTAIVVMVVLGVVLVLGYVWINGLLDPGVPFNAVLTGLYGVGLTLAMGAVALWLRDPRFALWRGVALAVAVAGIHAGLSGALLTLDISLRWPGVPAWVAPLVSLIVALVTLVAFRGRFLGRPRLTGVLIGAALGLLLSAGWLAVGALGRPVELALALLAALGTATLAAVLIALPFAFDEGILAERPGWSALLAGGVLAALLPGLLVGRGYRLQGNFLSAALIPAGVLAGALLTAGDAPQLRRNWWSALAVMLTATLLPFAWTEGFEGDWMMEELSGAWGRGLIAALLVGGLLAVAALVVRRAWPGERRSALGAGGLLIAALLIDGGVYVGLGQPGMQPEVVFVVMAEQADTDSAASIADRDARYAAVYEATTAQALASQADIRAFLDTRGVTYTPYYLVNGLEIELNAPGLHRRLAARPDVVRILESPHARPLPDYVHPLNTIPAGYNSTTVAWGVDEIDADRVWTELGVTGEGVVVGIADSGVDWTHPALQDSYLGSAGDHTYTWFDPWEGTTEPTDAGGHGTHTTGTILGNDGIGVAPDAQWIACRNLARNLGDPAYYLDCMQFLLAPFPPGGDPFTDGDPARGADLTSNSWGCPPEEGCDGLTLPIAIGHLHDAGQLFVVSAGNEGPQCGTVDSPATAADALTVGAVDQSGEIASFSSRGPALLDDSGRIKPDVSAPGVNVLSSRPGGDYGVASGTSMAGPHVAGMAALIWSANPALVGDVDTTVQIIEGTAIYETAPDLCGAAAPDDNNVYGHGRIDALDAVQQALSATP